jgi:hypothetical protein
VHARQALLHEELVADAEDLIDEQDIRFDVEGERERESRIHAG